MIELLEIFRDDMHVQRHQSISIGKYTGRIKGTKLQITRWKSLELVSSTGAALDIDLVVTPFALDLFLFPNPVLYTLIISLTGEGWSGALFLVLLPL